MPQDNRMSEPGKDPKNEFNFFIVKATGKDHNCSNLEDEEPVPWHKVGLSCNKDCALQARIVYMGRLVNLILFLGCAVAFGHYYGWASLVQLTAVVAATLGLMRILSGKRIN